MILSFIKAEEESFDLKMQMLSWQTALLMNSTGNFKKKIKPDDLYIPLADIVEKEKRKNEGFDAEERKRLQEELLQSFKDSNIDIQ